MNVVFESDSHSVKTTWPIVPVASNAGGEEGFLRDDVNGTIYMGEGCWGAPLRGADDGKSWSRSYGSFNQFKLGFVDKNKVELRTIKIENVETVEEVDLNNRFSLPLNLSVWNPRNGDVVTIRK